MITRSMQKQVKRRRDLKAGWHLWRVDFLHGQVFVDGVEIPRFRFSTHA